MRIGIVDDHILISKAIASILSNYDNAKIVMIAENGLDLISQFENMEKNEIPEIILLDISMPLMNGFETADWLKENHPDVKIIVLSMHDDVNSIITMIKKGVQAYLFKNVNSSDLIECIKTVYANGFYFSSDISNIVFRNMMESSPSNNENIVHLTEREKEILKLMVTEKSYKEIAEDLSISPRTLEIHRDNLASKLNVKTRVGMAVYAIKNNLDK